VNGKVEGPIQGGEIILKSWAQAIFTIDLWSLRVALASMVVRWKFPETDRRTATES
jgi:hypothetical protein